MRAWAWLGADSCSLGSAGGLSPAPGGQVATWQTKPLTISTNWHSCGRPPTRGQGAAELGGWASRPGSEGPGQGALPPPPPHCRLQARDSAPVFWQPWRSPGPPVASDSNYPAFSSAVNASAWPLSYTGPGNLPHPPSSLPFTPSPWRGTSFLGSRCKSLSLLPSSHLSFFSFRNISTLKMCSKLTSCHPLMLNPL